MVEAAVVEEGRRSACLNTQQVHTHCRSRSPPTRSSPPHFPLPCTRATTPVKTKLHEFLSNVQQSFEFFQNESGMLTVEDIQNALTHAGGWARPWQVGCTKQGLVAACSRQRRLLAALTRVVCEHP